MKTSGEIIPNITGMNEGTVKPKRSCWNFSNVKFVIGCNPGNETCPVELWRHKTIIDTTIESIPSISLHFNEFLHVI